LFFLSQMDNKLLIENHLYFLSSFRGERESTPEAEYIHSDSSFFNIAIPSSLDKISLIPSQFLIYAYDFLQGKIPDDLKKFIGLSYMKLSNYENNRKENSELKIKLASSEKDIEDFSLAQAKGFATSDNDFKEWYPWLLERNMKNLNNENSRFYTGYINNEPSATGLSIMRNNIAGIYAVATIKAHRKKHLSTSIMKKLVNDAAELKVDTVTLQVDSDSHAHDFYKKLGFEDAFHCTVYKKPIDAIEENK